MEYQLNNNITREEILSNKIEFDPELLNKKGIYFIGNELWYYYVGYTNNLLLTIYQLYYNSFIGQQNDILTRGINAYLTFGEPLYITYDDNNEDITAITKYIEQYDPVFNSSLTNQIVKRHSQKITQSEKSQYMKNGMSFKYITGDDEYVYYLASDLLIYGIERNREAQHNV